MKFLAPLAALILTGCAATPFADPHVKSDVAGSRAASYAPAATPEATLTEAPKPLGLAWECYATVPNEITGIESSTNLVAWKLEAEWRIVTVSNTWTDPVPISGQKFYRAFNREP